MLCDIYHTKYLYTSSLVTSETGPGDIHGQGSMTNHERLRVNGESS